MKLNNLGFSEKALDIETKRPSGWEYLLLAQLLDEEIDSVNFVLQQELGIKSDYSSEFYSIRSFDDLKRIFSGISKDMAVVKKFITIFDEMSFGKNEAAFGPIGKPGNPVLLQLLAKRVANVYYEMAIFCKKKKLEKIEFNAFIHRNIDMNLEKLKLFCNAIVAANSWYIKNAEHLMQVIVGYGSWMRSKLNDSISGGTNKAVLRIDAIDTDELVEIINKATEFLPEFLLSVEEEEFASTNSSLTRSTISKSKVTFVDLNCKRFNSLDEITHWIVNQKQIQQSELRELLLPLDYFPGAFIDGINERALDLAGETALDEIDNQVNIKQDILRQIIANENKIF